MINQAAIDEIKARMDILEVVSDYVSLKKSGSSYKALSPFTAEKTPSFVVTPSMGIFKCFSSGKAGDAIGFIQEIDGLSYVEALKWLAQKYGIPIEESQMPDGYAEAQSLKESLYIVLNFAKEYYKKNLHESDEGRNVGLSYFRARGFSNETISKFDLGYASDQWDGLIKEAKSSGYNEAFLEKAGLKVVKENKEYDRFRGRVIFPIHNIAGKTIAFAGRVLSDEKKQPKYINSPETELYHKSHILYGIYQAKNKIRNEDNCYLVEGYTDVIALHQAGIHNAAAASGTSLTEDQIRLIKRFSDNVTVLFDGDKAGVKAAMRGIDMILEGGLNVKAVPLPEGEDPDSYSKLLGAEAFKKYLDDEARDFIAFKAAFFLEQGGNEPQKKAEAIKEIVHSISLIPDAIKRRVYIQECGHSLEMEESVLITELNKLLIKKSQAEIKKEWRQQQAPQRHIRPGDMPLEAYLGAKKIPTTKQTQVAEQERDSIRMLLTYGSEVVVLEDGEREYLINYFMAEAADLKFETPIYKRILDIFVEKLNEGKVIDYSHLLAMEDKEIKQAAVDVMTSKYEVSENWLNKFEIITPTEKDMLRKATYHNVLRLKFRIVQKMAQDNMFKLKSASGEKEVNQLLEVHNDLKQYEKSIAEVLGNVIT